MSDCFRKRGFDLVINNVECVRSLFELRNFHLFFDLYSRTVITENTYMKEYQFFVIHSTTFDWHHCVVCSHCHVISEYRECSYKLTQPLSRQLVYQYVFGDEEGKNSDGESSQLKILTVFYLSLVPLNVFTKVLLRTCTGRSRDDRKVTGLALLTTVLLTFVPILLSSRHPGPSVILLNHSCIVTESIFKY